MFYLVQLYYCGQKHHYVITIVLCENPQGIYGVSKSQCCNVCRVYLCNDNIIYRCFQ